MLGDSHDSYCLLYNCMLILGLDEHALEEKLGGSSLLLQFSLAGHELWHKRKIQQIAKVMGIHTFH